MFNINRPVEDLSPDELAKIVSRPLNPSNRHYLDLCAYKRKAEIEADYRAANAKRKAEQRAWWQVQEERRAALIAMLTVPHGQHTLCLDARTETPVSAHYREIVGLLKRRNLRIPNFITVRVDGSAVGHFEWPNHERISYPPGTFHRDGQ